MVIKRFPIDFKWGVATSSQQIEGGSREGGRSESIWDRLASTPGKISDGSNPATACDHYHRWRDDVKLIKCLGVDSYRFSISWPRILPKGTGKINRAGLDFYDSLVDSLLEEGINPFPTLYHWDLPQMLQDLGGWGSRDTAEAFVEYTNAVMRCLGDRVKDWTTHNEPWCIASLGHEAGEHAPGHRDPAETLRVAHHVLLSHGWAVREIRRIVPGSRAGIVLNLVPVWPASDSAEDGEAAREFDGMFNRWYLDPIFKGRYPEDAIEDRVRHGHLSCRDLPFVMQEDLETISTPIDFLGINYYSRVVMRSKPETDHRSGEDIEEIKLVSAGELTDMGWEVYPEELYELLSRVDKEYAPERIYITENGAAYSEGPDESGRIRDDRRIDYLDSHFAVAHRAIAEGVPLKGYFVWSLFDNFEWAHGYTKRFGLYWVDFETQERIPKDSAFFYRDYISAVKAERN